MRLNFYFILSFFLSEALKELRHFLVSGMHDFMKRSCHVVFRYKYKLLIRNNLCKENAQSSSSVLIDSYV